MAVTTFFTCVSGVFLLAGAGAPGVRIMVAVIFFISLLNLSVYARELYETIRSSHPGGVRPEPPQPAVPNKPGGGGPPGGGGQGGDNGGGRRE